MQKTAAVPLYSYRKCTEKLGIAIIKQNGIEKYQYYQVPEQQ